MMSSSKGRLFADCRCLLSEAPIWNARENMLYWRGAEGEIYRKAINDDAGDYECFRLNIGNIGSIVLASDGNMLLFGDCGKIWKWKAGSEPSLYIDTGITALFNDCLTDPKGRVYCGVLAENFFDVENRGKYGSFWCLDTDGTFRCIEEKTGAVPNGIRLSPDCKYLYFAVTDDDTVYRYDYDIDSGNLSNRYPLIKNCCPDGIAVDMSGNVWVANCAEGMPVQCFDSSGKLIKEYYLPVCRTISVAFGECDKKTLFVTTAREHPVGENDGGVFCFREEISGSDEYLFRDIRDD